VTSVPAPARAARPVGAHRAAEPEIDRDPNWNEYALRRRLVEVGVPVEWIPDGADNAYWVVEQLVRRVPSAPAADARPGEVVVVAGPGPQVLDAARTLAARLRVDPDDVYGAGCDARQQLELWTAGPAAALHRSRGGAPMIVAVALDDADDAGSWGAQVVRALVADRLHLVVDAGRKSADVRRTIAAVGPVRSLFVTGAARTASPASVWELGVPVELVDGRPATTGTWAALLIDALAALDAS
jgi:hypothetical protein